MWKRAETSTLHGLALTAAILLATAPQLVGCQKRPKATPQMTAWAVLPDKACVATTPEEEERIIAAVGVLEAFRWSGPASRIGLYNEAMGFLAMADNRRTGAPSCLGSDIEDRIVRATVTAGAWDTALIDWNAVRLARRLGPRHPKIIAAVARSAFHPYPWGSYYDVRPEARSTLASFGVAAAPWREQALSEMNNRDALGTSAAQVAAASREPAAVKAVADLMDETLKRAPKGVISNQPGIRLVELAYALGGAGPAARPHLDIIRRALDRDVESLAPPFGMLEMPPYQMCYALDLIGGSEAADILQRSCAERTERRFPG